MIDLHSHILPGLDDGSPNLEVSLAMARLAHGDGITDMVGTPHLFRGASNLTDFGLLEKKQTELQAALDRESIPLVIHRGVEIRFSHNLLDELQKHRPHLVLAGSSYMFIEFPFDYVYSGVKEVFFNVMSEGIVPVVTHPERCTGFINHPEVLFELVEMGALAQANAGSFAGRYGSQVREAAYLFLGSSYIQFVASDAHDTDSRPPILSAAVKSIEPIVGPQAAMALVRDNPRAVLEDKPLPFQPEPVSPDSPPEKHFRLKIPSLFKTRKPE
jgi:protein-tyrosine phosphatase